MRSLVIAVGTAGLLMSGAGMAAAAPLPLTAPAPVADSTGSSDLLNSSAAVPDSGSATSVLTGSGGLLAVPIWLLSCSLSAQCQLPI
ncbi:hypothetical protein [Nocardia sp. NPDC006630]|uniref:hypothetical protein n=1 Tax=Nocardia sp. NPDC006630 TaxID=3157181 RepID=UPI0033BAFCA9